MAASREKQANRRIRLLLAIFTLVFAALLGRGFWIQGVQAGRLAKLAQGQHQKQITTPAGRGTIFDRNGVQLAIGEQMTTVFADPQQVVNASAIAIAAHKAFGVDSNSLYPALLNKKSQFVYVKRFADPLKAAAFLKKGFAGISSYQEEKRAYPQGGVGSQLIGYAGVDNRGLGGLEFEYDHKLAGHSGKQTVVRDATGRSINVISSSPVQEGADVFTTIDHTIQANAEQVLRATVSKWGAQSATAIVLDPTTGEVLAMAQAPGYNANNTSSVDAALTRNRAVTDTYEPGSTFKLVTVTGVLSEGLVKPTTRFYAARRASRSPTTASTTPNSAALSTTASRRFSSTRRMSVRSRWPRSSVRPRSRIGSTASDSATPPESIIPAKPRASCCRSDQWSGSTIGNVPIGQGIAVTAIQMASVYAAVANDGVWVQPHLVSRVGGRAPFTPKRRRIMSPGIDREVKAMLKDVVLGRHRHCRGDSRAIRSRARPAPAAFQVRTGTPIRPGTWRPSSGWCRRRSRVSSCSSSSTGLAEPSYGGIVAAPAFQSIAKFDLQYLGVTPDAPRTALSAG